MPLVTKAEFAETLRVSRPRISQYVKSGLPVRRDGLINLDDGLNWVSRNVEPDANCGGAGELARNLLRERTAKGGSRRSAPARRKGGPPIPEAFGILDEIENPADGSMVVGLLLLVSRVGSLASIAAHGAGADRKVAERTGEVFTALFVQAATDMLVECGVEPISSNPDSMKWPHPRNFDRVQLEGARASRRICASISTGCGVTMSGIAISLTFDKRLSQLFEKAGAKSFLAVGRALDEIGGKTRTQVIRATAKQTGVKVGRVRQVIRTKQALGAPPANTKSSPATS